MLQKLLLFLAGLALGATVTTLRPLSRRAPAADDPEAPGHEDARPTPETLPSERPRTADRTLGSGPLDPSLQAALNRIDARLERLEAALAEPGGGQRRALTAEAAGPAGLRATVAPVVAAVLAEQRALDEQRQREQRAEAELAKNAEREREVRMKAAHVARELGLSDPERDLFADALSAFSRANLELQQAYATSDPNEWVQLQEDARATFAARIRQDLAPAAAERILEWF